MPETVRNVKKTAGKTITRKEVIDIALKQAADSAKEWDKYLEDERKRNQMDDYIRSEVQDFAGRMEDVLRQNDYKHGWRNCETEFLLDKLLEEVAELVLSKCDRDYEPLRYASRFIVHLMDRNHDHGTEREAVDVANVSMMLWDNERE